ncbi:syndecan-2-like [Montipora foliosa]|uniref:syndecan-2-like n=1 Tax=Montipora foliosa TaxID=591990 RepID=UPI0035F1A1B2
MRPKLLLFVCVAVSTALLRFDGAMANYEGLIDIDDSVPSTKTSDTWKPMGEVDEEDEDDGSAESGSGSGETDGVDVSVASASTTETSATTQGETTTEITNDIPEKTEEPTEKHTDNGIDDSTSHDGEDDVGFGGVGKEPNSDDSDALALKENEGDRVGDVGEKGYREKGVITVLTAEVIAAVVVGAVCAVILIAFLVYRLRKRDEGSYALSDVGYKDTYKLQGDYGKEAFV